MRPPSLELTVLNGFSATCGGRDIRLRGRKARALLAFLALCDGASFSRERLVGLLWADVEEDKARASLRQSLKELRDALDPDEALYLRTERTDVALIREHVSVDLHRLLAGIDTGSLPATLLEHSLAADRILADLDDVAPDFHIWLAGFRQSCHERLTAALTHQVHSQDMSRDQPRLKTACQALLNLDPTNELASRHLIRILAAEGDAAGALRLYNRLWQLLEDDYDIEPSAETQALIVEIKRGLGTASGTVPDVASTAHAGADGAPKTTQATLLRPLIEVSGLKGLELAETSAGLLASFRHELLASLVRFREWAIVDRSIELETGAGHRSDFAVDLSAYPTPGGAQIVMTLRDTMSQHMIWSESYALDATSWFDVQREMIRRIAVALRVSISAETLQSRLPKRPNAASLHDLWIKGQSLFNGYTASQWSAAEEIFQDIIRQDPHFAPAHSSLTQLRNSRHLAAPGLWRDPETAAEALTHASSAAQADPMDSRAHLCLAWAHAMSGRYELALPYYQSAVALNENDPWTLTSACQGLAFLGQDKAAADLEAHLFRVSPVLSRTQWGYLVGTRFLRGDHDGTVEAGAQASDQISNLPGWVAAALALSGREPEARAEFARFVALIQARWHGPEPADALAVTHWFLHNFPIRQRRKWEALRDGLARAGAPFIDHAERRPRFVGAEEEDASAFAARRPGSREITRRFGGSSNTRET